LGRLDFKKFVTNNKDYFNNEVIKEPWMSYFHSKVIKMFPTAIYITVVRDPRDNIRSYLNRKSLPGNLKRLTMDQEKKAGYPYLFDSKIWNVSYGNYVSVLAHRWNLAADSYLINQDKVLLVRYEDFCKDKYGFISTLAKQLGIIKKDDISKKLNMQYQPRGDRKISWNDFFGQKNLSEIEHICALRMKQFKYMLCYR